MPLPHLLLAVFVVFIWGTNFVVIKWGLADFPPFLFATLRFVLSVLPWLFLVRRPQVSWTSLASVGMLLGVGQFGLLYWAMQGSISPGLASLVIQSQVFFTILIAVVLNGERLRALQYLAMLLAVGGYILVGWHSVADPGAAVTPGGLGLVLAAACCWACANTVVRRVGRVNMGGFIIWSSLFATLPLALLSLLLDGPVQIADALRDATWSGWAATLWQALGNTLLGFGIWNWLLVRHRASQVTPLALLVPVFGMLSAALLLDEPLPGWKLGAAALVLSGLALNVYAGWRSARA
ncbi:EamA family transporter [Bordetella avium]|uniref:Probable amino acid metabolite efflux pump n=1 Tax=Bordetella avium (strain 197N) TaxID=360910 RepID=Q2KXC0_BORA1|nr:EamA family transporter [Bordetella avium]AZY49872.1 EamA family transporter [Bordetella avium]AZY54370.1 EamA family transporter [Bordetella avium]RIQ13170.1 EamA family transporter [Bordetella avium]RIQ17228.1 EamA family transporter [Bordetella avium]RIQ33713.1 EamA family transporter [Bordetella avium]